MATFAIDLISGRVFLFVPEFGGSSGTTSGSTYPEVNLYSELPTPASAYNGQTYLVRQSEGDYVLNRKEAGLYFSNGITWYRLGDIPSFFSSDNFEIYDSADTSKGIKFVTTGITTSTFRNYVWQDTDGTVALLQDLDGKLDTSAFEYYTGVTAPATYLTISDFGVYSANTEVRLTGIENDIVYLSGETSGNTQLIYELSGKTKHYDGVDTADNILALPPSGYTGQLWYAYDTNMEYESFNVTTTNTDNWIGTHIVYDPNSDTFELAPTADGQVQNLGQEVFVNCYNTETGDTTSLDGKVFVVTGVYAPNEKFSNTKLAISSDIARGSIYGINTTDADAGGFFKMVTYGDINNFNTSSWAVNSILYISDTTEGELTDVQPLENPIAVGYVKKQDATGGTIFVNTIRQVSEGIETIPLNFTYNYFTGDLVTGVTGTNYYILPSDKGTVTAQTQIQTVGDDQRLDFDDDFLSPTVAGTPTRFNEGVYDAQLQIEIDNASENERIYIEVYRADSGGTVVDSGISGMSSGFSYNVRPVVQLQSSLLNLDTLTINDIYLSGVLLDDFTLNIGERLRTVVSVEKVGLLGGAKQFTMYYGTDYNAFIRSPYVPNLDDLGDVDTAGATDGSVIKYNSDTAVWVASFVEISEVVGLQTELDDINADIVYLSGETANKQERIIPLQLKDISGGTELNTITATTITWTTEEYTGTSLNFTGGSRIYIQESGDFTISYVLNGENQTNSFKQIGSLIRKNGSIDITPMSSSSYSRNASADNLTNVMSPYKVALTDTDYIELISFRIGNTGSVLSVPDGTWLKIEKI